ncbi:MAG: response regulator, partial [Bacteroidales bacterium]|nr:response regulator [Bacteroidales bacterium]
MLHKANHILIVDDNLKNLEVTAKILKEEGYQISLATSGMEAFSLLDQILPDLILLDVMMPEINGFEVCRMIKKKETLRSIPIIFLT